MGRNDDGSVKLLVKNLQAPKDAGERSESLWALRECPFLEFAMKQLPSPETTRPLRDLGDAE